MSNLIVQDSNSPNGTGPRFRPYASVDHHVTKGRYITSNDPRGYIPVYEYPLNGQWIMMDIDDGYILWTGIWKALGNSKADIVKMVDSQPDLASLIRRVRGGYLKIQGTWMPYEVALKLARRVAWPIREDLVPLFGPTFPSTCLSPDQPGYGQVVPSTSGRRRARRKTPRIAPSPQDGHMVWDASRSREIVADRAQMLSPLNTAQYNHRSRPRSPGRTLPSPTSPRSSRYTPYPSIGLTDTSYSRRSVDGLWSMPSSALKSPALSVRSDIYLPPIDLGMERISSRRSSATTEPGYALPPISALEDLRGVNAPDNSPAAVLKRLRERDDDDDRSVDSSLHDDSTRQGYLRKIRSSSVNCLPPLRLSKFGLSPPARSGFQLD